MAVGSDLLQLSDMLDILLNNVWSSLLDIAIAARQVYLQLYESRTATNIVAHTDTMNHFGHRVRFDLLHDKHVKHRGK